MFAYAGGFHYEGTHGITILEYDEKGGTMTTKGHTAPDLNAGCVVARNGMVYATGDPVPQSTQSNPAQGHPPRGEGGLRLSPGF